MCIQQKREVTKNDGILHFTIPSSNSAGEKEGWAPQGRGTAAREEAGQLQGWWVLPAALTRPSRLSQSPSATRAVPGSVPLSPRAPWAERTLSCQLVRGQSEPQLPSPPPCNSPSSNVHLRDAFPIRLHRSLQQANFPQAKPKVFPPKSPYEGFIQLSMGPPNKS